MFDVQRPVGLTWSPAMPASRPQPEAILMRGAGQDILIGINAATSVTSQLASAEGE
ncbi:hypothetical protein OIU34_35620 [Pararhizobium sp. BT-229]|uniref:hypothetical protein n=1 Tax=Pararhizobium sp. BT-229 TaxID=2986923 RepID=UPI0021F7396D|nr:hypothetical protein [Pararhizobium sp. BT-229]MCV9967164.1 hypothetical protein [Pararhizobium sp. BT-229]